MDSILCCFRLFDTHILVVGGCFYKSESPWSVESIALWVILTCKNRPHNFKWSKFDFRSICWSCYSNLSIISSKRLMKFQLKTVPSFLIFYSVLVVFFTLTLLNRLLNRISEEYNHVNTYSTLLKEFFIFKYFYVLCLYR